jgi:histidine triad (HIT) family protein
MVMNDCIFCKIINKEISANIIYEDDKTVAFLDNNPVNEGHTLVIPKKHFKNILEMDKEHLDAVFETVQRIAEVVKDGVNADGFNIKMNNFKAAGQVVFHAHVHIVPRFENDGYTLWQGKGISEEESSEVLAKIKEKL